ncbi:MAG: carboxypeptidase-like regulatory domain-containing protein [Cyclobacteriaceae bacterium]
MKHFFLLFLCFELPALLCAQNQISGTVQNVNGTPLPFANVLLLSDKDSSLVKGAVSETKGNFYFNQVPPNKYLISITSVGFHSYLDRIKMPLDEQFMLPPAILKELEEELEEVTVTAQKPLYEKQTDRMVVNVQESITAAGSSVLEVLSRSPGVLVNQQQYNITLNGREGVMVMVNNTLTRMPMESVMQMLEGMSAANVEKIELISQPPPTWMPKEVVGSYIL